jgi:DNA polymerase III subunit alpha
MKNEHDFVHLQTHSDYSLLQGMCTIPSLVEHASQLGMCALALTDTYNLYGVPEFNAACRKHDIKPIFGCEMSGLVLLARDMTGYKNLTMFISCGGNEDSLAEYADGLICITGMAYTAVGRLIINDKHEDASRRLQFYRDTFGDGQMYLGLQNHSASYNQLLPHEEKVNRSLHGFSVTLGIPLVVTNHTCYLEPGDAPAHRVFTRFRDIDNNMYDKPHIPSVQAGISEKDFSTDQHYLASAEEMCSRFPFDEEALENTVKIAGQCNVELPVLSPQFPACYPENSDADSHLEKLVFEGLRDRYDGIRGEATDRANHELAIVLEYGCANHFLFIHDCIRYARDTGLPVGPGRGRYPASIICYALGISDIDPLHHRLIFECFINPRSPFPRFEIDIGRGERTYVIEYLSMKYGRESIGFIPAFTTLIPQGAIRLVGEVLGIIDIDQVLSLLPGGEEDICQKGQVYQDLIEISTRLTGIKFRVTLHAAGIVASPRPLTDFAAIEHDTDGNAVVQCPSHQLHNLGLEKIDLLEMRELSFIQETIERIWKVHNVRIHESTIPYDDPSTMKLFASGDTKDIFNFRSETLRAYMVKLGPEQFTDLTALSIALRPALFDTRLPALVNARNYYIRTGDIPGISNHARLNELLEPVLAETYGLVLYREQIVEILCLLTGISAPEAELAWQDWAAGDTDRVAEIRNDLISSALQQGVNEDAASDLCSILHKAMNTTYRKSHAVAYTRIAYQMAFLKAHYRNEFSARNIYIDRSRGD